MTVIKGTSLNSQKYMMIWKRKGKITKINILENCL